MDLSLLPYDPWEQIKFLTSENKIFKILEFTDFCWAHGWALNSDNSFVLRKHGGVDSFIYAS